MPPTLSEDEIDDLLYFARTGDLEEFNALSRSVCKRESLTVVGLLEAARDEMSGNGVLHMAAANGHDAFLTTCCKELSHPTPQNPVMLAILNAQNKAGNTALHWAALNGHLPAVKVLLDQGADPTITNHKGHDPVYEAELNDKQKIVDWVLKEGGEGLEQGVSGESAEGEDDAAEEDETRTNGGTNGDSAEQGSKSAEWNDEPIDGSSKLEEKLKGMHIHESSNSD